MKRAAVAACAVIAIAVSIGFVAGEFFAGASASAESVVAEPLEQAKVDARAQSSVIRIGTEAVVAGISAVLDESRGQTATATVTAVNQ